MPELSALYKRVMIAVYCAGDPEDTAGSEQRCKKNNCHDISLASFLLPPNINSDTIYPKDGGGIQADNRKKVPYHMALSGV